MKDLYLVEKKKIEISNNRNKNNDSNFNNIVRPIYNCSKIFLSER